MNRKCNNLQTPKSEEQRQLDILKRMVEKRTSAVMLESFIKRLSIPSVSKYKGLTGDDLVNELTKDFSKQEAPEHKKYVHRDGRPLLTLNDFNRANLTRNERLAITEDIKENIVHNCLFDIKGGTGEIRSLEKVNENILAYKLQVMNELADILGVDEAVRVKTTDDVLFNPKGEGEYNLQQFLLKLEELCESNNLLSERTKHLYNVLKYFDTILLANFENVIDFDSEYKDDGFIYANKYIYKGPGANLRKGYQDNKSEGYADAWDNMSNMTKMVTNYIPRYTEVGGAEYAIGYVGDKMAVLLFAELWDFVTNLYNSSVFRNNYVNDFPEIYLAITGAIDNPGTADWDVIVNHYIETRCALGNTNIRECMKGLYKHVFEKGKGTWLYEDFVSCIQKYRKTSYGIISKVRNSDNKYMEFNELKLWTEQQANFKLQDQIAYSTIVNHVRYSTPEARMEFAKQIGLKVIDDKTFSLQIGGKEVTITVNKKDTAKAATFEISYADIDDEAILDFLLVNMNINVSKDALLLLQQTIHPDSEKTIRSVGQVKVKARVKDYFKTSVAPLFGLWVNSVFDAPIEIDGKTFKPQVTFDKRYFNGEQLGINNFSPYYSQLWSMASILQIVHNENVSNVIKNGKGNNVPTTQLATIQQDGPMLHHSVQKEETRVQRENLEEFKEKIDKAVIAGKKGRPTKGFKSISQYNPSLSQPDFCRTDSLLSAGISNGPLVKESKELKAGELIHNELMYLFAQPYFEDQSHIYSQATANADKNLQALRGLALDIPISYAGALGTTKHQNHTLRSIINSAMKGDNSGAFEYYKLHNAKATLALENNICHAYNCAFSENPDWVFVDNIEDLMSQLIKLRYAYLNPPIANADKKTEDEIRAEKRLLRKDKFDWTLSSIKEQFREKGLDFNETTYGISATVKGVIEDAKIGSFECVQFPKDMVRDFQIARRAVNDDYKALERQSFLYEKSFIEDLIDEVCDINTTTDNYFKELCKTNTMMQDWVTDSGDMIFAKFMANGNEVKLTAYSSADDVARFKMLNSADVKINPLIHAYHLVQFTVNTQMNEAYNGTRFSIGVKDGGVYITNLKTCEVVTKETSMWGDKQRVEGKKDDDIKIYNKHIAAAQEDWEKEYFKVENARMVNYYKRATVNGTREHRILHGDKYNIPEQVYTATFEDPEGYAFLSSNLAAKCKAQDGSIWVTPWHARQMDVGAGEAKLPPGVRKTMYHDIDPITGGATLLKMAEFPITNEMRRLSMSDKMQMELILMKLANRKLIKLDMSDGDIRLGLSTLNDFFENTVMFEKQEYNMNELDFGTYYAFTIQLDVTSDGKLQIIKKKWEVNENGDGNRDKAVIETYDIDTIYQIDRVLGGAYSCDLTKNGLVLGESQNNFVNQIICELNLKENYTAYAVNKESIKNNIKNVNSSSEWFEMTDNLPTEIKDMGKKSTLWTSRISTKFGGIILNALHEMDEDVDVARGVQMLSEMIQNGNQYGEVEAIYSNVRLGIQDALQDYVKALSDDDAESLQNLIFNTIIDSLTNGKDKTKVSLAQEFVLGVKAAKEEKGIDISAIPISDKALYDLLITTIVGKINKEGIRARNAGFGGVKHPSFGVAKIFEVWVPGKDKKFKKVYAKHHDVMDMIVKFMKSDEYESYKGTWKTAGQLFKEIQLGGQLNPFIQRTESIKLDVDLGETIVYHDGTEWKSFEISSDRAYQYFKRIIEPIIEKGSGKIYRNVFAGRRLRGYRTSCTYTNSSGETRYDLMFNTDDNYLITSMKYVREAFEKIIKIMRNEELWDPKEDARKQVMDFIKTADGEGRRIFVANCEKITGFKFREDFTIDDLEKRVEFIRHYFSRGDGKRQFERFFKIQTGDDFSTWVAKNYGDGYEYSFEGFNYVLDETKTIDESRTESCDKKMKKILGQFLEEQRIQGIATFTENKVFNISKRVTDEFGAVHYEKENDNVITDMLIRTAEYMKSKGNVSKQFLIDRGDSMFKILSEGEKYFENKLKTLYAQPTDPKLLYDVAIYDKYRRPIYIKYDPEYKYADYFSKRGGEYYAIKNGIFSETNGSVYYKDRLVCDSNKMTSWIKHGENGEKYNVITVFDEAILQKILGGEYGKREELVHRIVPRVSNQENLKKITENLNAQVLSVIPTKADIEQWRQDELDDFIKTLHKNTPEDSKEIIDFKEELKAKSDEEIINKHIWKLAENEHKVFVNKLSNLGLLTYSWTNLDSKAFNSWMQEESKMMYESFLKQLKAIGTRIPSQAMQSMMPMECVGYLDADYNEEMASIEMTYIQGSDYDIDKDYITEYFIDDTGFVGDGSKLQQYSAFKDRVETLPPPNGNLKAKNVKYAKSADINNWDITESDEKHHVISVDDAREIVKWIESGKDDPVNFAKFKEILEAVNNGKKLHVTLQETVWDESGKEHSMYSIRHLTSNDYAILRNYYKSRYNKNDVKTIDGWFEIDHSNGNRIINDDSAYYLIADAAAQGLLQGKLFQYGFKNHLGNLHKIKYYINQHQTSIVSTSKDSQNRSLTKELSILSNPQNIAAMEISVDLSLDNLKDFAKERGVQSKNGLSVWSAASKFKAQDTNLLGKTGVGVAANADKVYFTVYYYHTKVLNEIKTSWFEYIAKINEISRLEKYFKERSNISEKQTIRDQINKLTAEAKAIEVEVAKTTMRDITKVLTTNPFNITDIKCLSKLNWNVLKELPDFNVVSALGGQLSEKQKGMLNHLVSNAVNYYNERRDSSEPKIANNQLTFKQLLQYLQHVSDLVDGPTLLSALVSAATDNAKELVLSKLNAFGDILDAYGMCASLGIPFEDTAGVFTSPLLNACVKEVRGDIYDPSNFASKIENSFGMFIADFKKNSEKQVKINSILTPTIIRNLILDKGIGQQFLESDVDMLRYKLPEVTAEAAVRRLKSDNRRIDDIIRHAYSKLGEQYSPSSYEDDWSDDWEYILESEMEAFDENVAQTELKWSNANIVQKMAFISFLKRIKLRNNAIVAELYKAYDPKTGKYDETESAKQLESIKKQVEKLENIQAVLMPKLYEQQILHKVLGVTKGIEGKPQQLYRYIREVEYFVNKKYKNYGEKGLPQDFDFITFFKDADYAKEQIAKYEKVCEFTNVLECLYTNEYIGEMLKTVGDTNELLNRVSVVYKNTQEIAKQVESDLKLHRPLNQKEYSVVSGLVNEYMVYDFLTYHSPYLGISLNIDPDKNENIYAGDNLTNIEKGHRTLRINTMADIASFKRLSNLFFFPDLLQDYAEHKGQERFGGKNGNIFLEALIAGGYQRVIPDSKKTAVAIEEMVWKLAYNLNEDISDETSEYALQMKKDFEAIFKQQLRYKNKAGEWVDRGITVGDFIYLYNLVVYKNSGTRNSFTKLFENAEEFRKMSKILPQYNAYVALMDTKKREFELAKNKDFMTSVKMKLAAMKNSKLKDIVQKQGVKIEFVKNRDYPFEFVLKSYTKDSMVAQADFYDAMTNLITQNAATKSTESFENAGIYYVQQSMLPESPNGFVADFGTKFIMVTSGIYTLDPKTHKLVLIGLQSGDEEINIEKAIEEENKRLIITDAALAEDVKNHGYYKELFAKSFIHSERELVDSNIGSTIEGTIVRLPYNATFATILENTINPKIERTRPIILKDAIRTLWDASGLDQDGYNFNEFVKFESATTVGQYTDHRRFAKAWFEYTNDKAVVHINIDNCDDANVVLHEMSHLLLLIAKSKNYDEYIRIANAFLQKAYENGYEDTWENFKAKYPATVRGADGKMEKLSDDLLFDEFVIDAISKQTQYDWNLNGLVRELKSIKSSVEETIGYKTYLKASKVISERVAKGEYEIKCD